MVKKCSFVLRIREQELWCITHDSFAGYSSALATSSPLLCQFAEGQLAEQQKPLLVILVDHEHAFVGSREVSHDLVFNQPPSALREFLAREFPHTNQDDVLIIRGSKIIEEKLVRAATTT